MTTAALSARRGAAAVARGLRTAGQAQGQGTTSARRRSARVRRALRSTLPRHSMETRAMPAAVTTRIEGPVITITLDRPECRNAVDGPTAAALRAAFEAFEHNAELAVAVLHGANGTFCAGADLKALGEPQRANAVEPHGTAPGPMGPTRMLFSKPVIAAIEG